MGTVTQATAEVINTLWRTRCGLGLFITRQLREACEAARDEIYDSRREIVILKSGCEKLRETVTELQQDLAAAKLLIADLRKLADKNIALRAIHEESLRQIRIEVNQSLEQAATPFEQEELCSVPF